MGDLAIKRLGREIAQYQVIDMARSTKKLVYDYIQRRKELRELMAVVTPSVMY